MNNYEGEQLKPYIPDRLDGKVEIDGISVKCISSNIRRPGISWNSLRLMVGKGLEGNVVVVEALTNTGSTTTCQVLEVILSKIGQCPI